MVDVEQRTLRALEQERVTATAGFLDECRDVGDHRFQLRRERQCRVQRCAIGNGIAFVILGQHEVVELEQQLELGGEAVGVEDVLQAQCASRYLVFVGGADAAPGGADLGLSH